MMLRRMTLVALLVLAVGCKRKPANGPSQPLPESSPAPAALQPIGTKTPFGPPAGDAAKLAETARAALGNHKPQVAVAALQNVLHDAPDYTPARWQLVSALAQLGRFDEAVSEHEALLARDFVAYAGRLNQRPEFAALRQSSAWAKVAPLEARYRSAYAAGLDKGFFFVARTRRATEPEFPNGAVEARLALRQEVLHYDPQTARFRRLTETGGHAFAIDRTPDGKTLLFLAVDRLHRERGVDELVDPRVGALALTTLETSGPFTQKGRYEQVGLGTNSAGQPLFTFVTHAGAATAYTIDTARTALAPLSGDGLIPQGGETRAWANQVTHFDDKAVPGVKIEDGATQFLVEGAASPVIAARPIAQSSLAWSPAKERLTYAGKLDACQILRGEKDKNELYVYDKTSHSAQRIAAAVSLFEALWLDDDRLVYEGGVGKAGQLHLYTFSTHADTTLGTRYGAGLYGVPTLACDRTETGVDEEVNEEEEAND